MRDASFGCFPRRLLAALLGTIGALAGCAAAEVEAGIAMWASAGFKFVPYDKAKHLEWVAFVPGSSSYSSYTYPVGRSGTAGVPTKVYLSSAAKSSASPTSSKGTRPIATMVTLDVSNDRSPETEAVGRGERSQRLPPDIQEVARRKLRMLNNAQNLHDLRVPPNNRLEALRGNRKGEHPGERPVAALLSVA